MILFETYKFIYFIIIGIIIGIIFDIFRGFRRSFKTSDIITYIHDIVFLIISACILLLSIFVFGNGELRGYMFIGICIGAFIHFIYLSKYIIKVFTNIFNFLKRMIVKPLKLVYLRIQKLICRLVTKIKQIHNNLNKKEEKTEIFRNKRKKV